MSGFREGGKARGPAGRGKSTAAGTGRGRDGGKATGAGAQRRHGGGKAAGAGAGRDRGNGAPRGAPTRNMAAVRIEQVQDVLGEILQWAYPADAVLSHWFRAHSKLGARDRGELADAVFDVLRHLRRYRQFAESGTGPASRRLAILGLASVLPGAGLADGLFEHERQWLDHVRGIDLSGLPRAVRESLPDWLEERVAPLPDADALVAALNRPAPMDIRANPLKAKRDDVLAQLREGPAARFDPVATPFSPWGIRLRGRPQVNRWPMFESGDIEVQDEGSQILAALVAPKRGEMVVDYCAGAGGKALLMGALMRSTGRLYVFDISAARLARAKPRFARSGLSNVVPVVIQEDNDQRVKRLRGKAHKVLVDAPCSGLGTLRRNPDLKWRQHPDSLRQLQATQARILAQAARCVAPGGRLVYATCSILPEENENQIEKFLSENQQFTVVDAHDALRDRCENLTFSGPYLELRPDIHGTDGFFGAVLQCNR